MKRTKRYGGFLVGDKVKAKGYDKLNGEVVGFLNGYLKCVFNEIAPRVEVVFAPNQLINLTRIEEERTKGGIGTIPPKTKLVVLEDLPVTPFEDKVIGNIQEARLKLAELQDKELKAEREFINRDFRETDIILSPLSPYGDTPSPYPSFYDCTINYKLN